MINTTATATMQISMIDIDTQSKKNVPENKSEGVSRHKFGNGNPLIGYIDPFGNFTLDLPDHFIQTEDKGFFKKWSWNDKVK